MGPIVEVMSGFTSEYIKQSKHAREDSLRLAEQAREDSLKKDERASLAELKKEERARTAELQKEERARADKQAELFMMSGDPILKAKAIQHYQAHPAL